MESSQSLAHRVSFFILPYSLFLLCDTFNFRCVCVCVWGGKKELKFIINSNVLGFPRKKSAVHLASAAAGWLMIRGRCIVDRHIAVGAEAGAAAIRALGSVLGGGMETVKPGTAKNMMEPDAPSPPRPVLSRGCECPLESRANSGDAGPSADGAACQAITN